MDGRPFNRHTAAMARTRSFVSPVTVLISAWPCLAAAQPTISPDLQQEAMTCAGEAMQICPDVWTAEDHGLACMTGKRAAFSQRCRAVYDKVDHALHPPATSRFASGHDRARPHEESR